MTRFILDTGIAGLYLDEIGRLAFELKRIGRPMGQNDITTAATARTLPDRVVVTMDQDLSAVPGLRTENWAEPI